MSEESKKDWERPWTTEEIVQHADNWNLACDAALLNTLKAFGDSILKKAEDVNDKIENLNKNLSKIHLQVDLARNEFSSLRNTQFVECRVYEDDETIPPAKPKDEEETNVPEEETIEDFREVVALGLEILDEFYDKVNVTVSDSEGEDEEGPSYVYRRKDPYIDRRLPHIIGSEEWHKKWHVGLEETDSENENSSEKLSDSESEDNLYQNKDHSDVSSEFSNLSDLHSSKVKPLVVSNANTTQDHIASSSGSDTSVEPTTRALSFAEQLAAKLGNVIKEAETPVLEPEVNRRPIQKKHSDFGALFSNEPPPLEDMREKESHGIFSGGKGLFDDEDEDDLWNPGKTITSSAKQVSSTGERKTKEFDRLDRSEGLFDEDSDDGIFASTKNYGITEQVKRPYLQSNKPTVPVFDEEPPIFEEDTNTKENRKPAGGVSLFGKSDVFHGENIGKILKQRKVSSSEDSNEEEPKFISKPKRKKSLNTDVLSPVDRATNENTQNKGSNKQTISSVPQMPQRKDKPEKKSTLFDDDIFGDDLFSSTAEGGSSGLFEKSVLFSDVDTVEPFLSRKSSFNEKTSKSGIKSGLYNDSQSNDLLSPETPDIEYSFRKNSKSNISILFDESRNDDDNIFIAKDDKKSTKTEDKNKKEKSNSETVSKKPKQNLFEDDLGDVDDLFSEISKKKEDTKIKNPKSFLFDNDEDDDFNIFMTKSDNKNSENVEQSGNTKIEKASTKIEDISESNQTNKSTKPKISLFDDDLDNMDDLFSQFSKDYNNESLRSEKIDNLRKTSELFNETNSSTKISINSNEATGNTNDKTNNVIKQQMEEKVSKELKDSKEKEEINKTESVIKSNSMEKPVNEKESVTNIDSIEKPTIEQKEDRSYSTEKSDISDILETSVKKQKQVMKSDTIPILKNVETNSIEKSAEESGHWKDNSSAEDVKKTDALITNKIITREEKIEEVKDEVKQEYPRKDNAGEVPKISIIEEPENVDIFEKAPVDACPTKIETEKYKNSPNVMNFMDSIPPPDDDWDTYSDNTFDDMEPGNDGFQSQPSSLFDSEPPFFFDDASDIPKGFIDDRFTSVPPLTQKISPDVFSSSLSASDKEQGKMSKYDLTNDHIDAKSNENSNAISRSESLTTSEPSKNSNQNSEENKPKNRNPNDELFPSPVNSSTTEKNRNVDKPKLSQKPKLKTEEDILDAGGKDKTLTEPLIIKDALDINKSEKTPLFDTAIPDSTGKNSDSLLENVLDSDQTDFLSSNEKQTNYDKENFKISENIISDKISKKSVPFDNVDENKIRTEEPAGPDSDDNMQSNISKITEKLQQISNKDEERTKPLVIPRKLSHNLNINVGALLPGSALPKREKSESSDENKKLSKSLPSSRFSLNEEFLRTKPPPIARVSSEDTPTTKDHKLEKSVSFDGGTDVEVLQSITKDRVRIPVKRRPSSRRARQKSLRDSISDFRLDDSIPDGEIPSEKNESMDNSTEQLSINQKTVESEDPKVLGDNLSTKISQNVLKEINVLKDETEDLFKIIEKDAKKTVNKANVISTKKKELFDDESEELFSEMSSKHTEQMDSLFQDNDNDLFENIKYASEDKHVRSESQDEVIKVSSDHNLETRERMIENEFLQSVQNSKIIPDSTKKSTIDDLFDSSDEDDIFKSTKVNVRKTKIEKDFKQKDDSSISIIGRIAGKTDETQSKTASGKSKPDNLFDLSDDDDFLEKFTSKKNDEKTKTKGGSEKPKTNSLFNDLDDDDIFGTSSTENKTKQDVKPSVINKKPLKSTNLRKLGNIEGEEDPLSALLK